MCELVCVHVCACVFVFTAVFFLGSSSALTTVLQIQWQSALKGLQSRFMSQGHVNNQAMWNASKTKSGSAKPSQSWCRWHMNTDTSRLRFFVHYNKLNPLDKLKNLPSKTFRLWTEKMFYFSQRRSSQLQLFSSRNCTWNQKNIKYWGTEEGWIHSKKIFRPNI